MAAELDEIAALPIGRHITKRPLHGTIELANCSEHLDWATAIMTGRWGAREFPRCQARVAVPVGAIIVVTPAVTRVSRATFGSIVACGGVACASGEDGRLHFRYEAGHEYDVGADIDRRDHGWMYGITTRYNRG